MSFQGPLNVFSDHFSDGEILTIGHQTLQVLLALHGATTVVGGGYRGKETKESPLPTDVMRRLTCRCLKRMAHLCLKMAIPVA